MTPPRMDALTDKNPANNIDSQKPAFRTHHFKLDNLLLYLCLICSSPVFAQLLPGDPLESEACVSCHIAGEFADSSTAFQLTDTQEQLCSRCHPGATQATHPSGVIPSMDVPSALPLDWKGEETCSTCHSIHQDGHAPLRVAERGISFCTYCHQQDFFDQMIDAGLSLFTSGHLSALTEYQSEQTDPFSIQCLGCHMEQGDSQSTPEKWENHPVRVRYQCLSCRPEEELPAAILIPGNNVSCVSCHQGYSQNHGAMVVSMEGSGLCLGCHQ